MEEKGYTKAKKKKKKKTKNNMWDDRARQLKNKEKKIKDKVNRIPALGHEIVAI